MTENEEKFVVTPHNKDDEKTAEQYTKLLNHEYDNAPTELTKEDINIFAKNLLEGKYDLKERPCMKCSKDHFPSYGAHLGECDQCYFERWPIEERTKFFRSFFE